MCRGTAISKSARELHSGQMASTKDGHHQAITKGWAMYITLMRNDQSPLLSFSCEHKLLLTFWTWVGSPGIDLLAHQLLLQQLWLLHFLPHFGAGGSGTSVLCFGLCICHHCRVQPGLVVAASVSQLACFCGHKGGSPKSPHLPSSPPGIFFLNGPYRQWGHLSTAIPGAL
jgi:hypothetical protein